MAIGILLSFSAGILIVFFGAVCRFSRVKYDLKHTLPHLLKSTIFHIFQWQKVKKCFFMSFQKIYFEKSDNEFLFEKIIFFCLKLSINTVYLSCQLAGEPVNGLRGNLHFFSSDPINLIRIMPTQGAINFMQGRCNFELLLWCVRIQNQKKE